MIKRTLTITLGTLLCFNCAQAGATLPGLDFLQISQGARATALGEAFTPLADDFNAVYHNPAGLGFIIRPEFQSTYTTLPGDMYMGSGGYLHPFPAGTLAIHTLSFGGTAITRIQDGALSDTFSPGSMASGLSFGFKVSDTFALGAAAKSVSDALDTDFKASLMLFDAGFLLRSKSESFSMGYCAQNLGTSEFSYSGSLLKVKTPLTHKFGFNFKADLPEQSSVINFIFQADKTEFQPVSYSAAIEHWGADILALRIGYKFLTDENSTKELDTLAGLRAGIGIHIRGIGVDYAYQPVATVGEVHRVSFVMKFVGWKVKPKYFDSFMKADPYIFSPNNDGMKDSTFFLPEVPQLTTLTLWKISIIDSNNIIVKTLSGQETLPKIINWDGKNDFGGFVSEGNYSAELYIEADGKRSQTEKAALNIDLTPAVLATSISNKTISPNSDGLEDDTTFYFTITDNNYIERWQVAIINSKGKTVKAFKSVDDSYGLTSINKELYWNGKDDVYGENVPNGDYKIQLTVYDVAGNKSSEDQYVTMFIPTKVEIREVVKEVVKKQEFQGLKISLSSEVLFDRGKKSMKPEAYTQLDKAIETLQTYPEYKVLIEGHTDISESKQNNVELSSSRAWNVYSYLVKKGIAKERLAVKGWGALKPIFPNTTRAGRMKNRRVEIVITKEKMALPVKSETATPETENTPQTQDNTPPAEEAQPQEAPKQAPSE